MENESDIKEKKTKKAPHGGARKNAGRKPGTKNLLSIAGLLDEIRAQSGGKEYEDLLVQDFMNARKMNDVNVMLKYHNLILNKVMNSLAKVEVTDSADAVEAKKLAFAEALAKLTGIQKD